MQKWQYMTWIVGYFHVDTGGGGKIKFLNGQEVPNWRNGKLLDIALQDAGENGWEMVSLTWIVREGRAYDPYFVLKRPSA